MRQRVGAVIINDHKILLLFRRRQGKEYFVFPGGGVEDGESSEEALRREIKEELNLDYAEAEKFFEFENEISNQKQRETFYLLSGISGNPELGGPEIKRQAEDNYYEIVYLTKKEFIDSNILPKSAKLQVQEKFNW